MLDATGMTQDRSRTKGLLSLKPALPHGESFCITARVTNQLDILRRCDDPFWLEVHLRHVAVSTHFVNERILCERILCVCVCVCVCV